MKQNYNHCFFEISVFFTVEKFTFLIFIYAFKNSCKESKASKKAENLILLFVKELQK